MNKSKSKNNGQPVKKTERVDFRFPLETKELMNSMAKKHNMKNSQYVRSLIEKDAHSISHEQQIQNSLRENHFINSLLANPDMPNKCKQLIGKELEKYV